MFRWLGVAWGWEQLQSVVEEAMQQSAEKDRVAVLLRYFQNKPLKEVGAELGLSENAARMRVERALEKLRRSLARKAVTSTVSALPLTLSGNAVTPAPAASAATLASASLPTAAKTGTAVTLVKIMAMTKMQFCAAAIILAAPTVILV